MRHSEIIAEVKVTDGFWSAPTAKDLAQLVAQHGDLRGIAYGDEIFLARAGEEVHHSIRNKLGLPGLYGHDGNEEPEGFDFYAANIAVHYEHETGDPDPYEGRDDWGVNCEPAFTVGQVAIWVSESTAACLSNKQFARMVRPAITESEETDKRDRDLANRVFDLLKDYLDDRKDYLDDCLTYVTYLGGSWAIRGSRFGSAEASDLTIVFAPRSDITATHASRGGFGKNGAGQPLIVLNCLLKPGSLKYIDTRIRGTRDIFVHEFMHYLAWKRNISPPQTSAELASGEDYAAYYNHAEELNAYYQEGVEGFERLVRNVISLGHGDVAEEMWGSKSTTELTWDILNKHIKSDFVAALTPENKRKIIKRIARFVEQTVRPIFKEDIADAA